LKLFSWAFFEITINRLILRRYSVFAVIRTGGKQYRAEPGAVLSIEKLEGEVGADIFFNEVLLVSGDQGTIVGQPIINGAQVTAEIVAQRKGPKLKIFKKQRRHGYQLRKGHRQNLTQVRIKDVVVQ